MKEAEMRKISHWIAEALDHRTDNAVLGKNPQAGSLGWQRSFPLYAERRARAQAEVRA